MKQLISQQFNLAVATYDAAAVLHREIGERLLERLNYIKLKPNTILDLGCNTGLFTEKLQQKYSQAKVYGLDIAYQMTEYCQSQARLKQQTLKFINADAESLPFADHSLDLIFSALVLQWCPNLAATFAEFRRVLKPDGLLLFATYGPDTLNELRESFKQIDEYPHVNDFIDMHDIGDLLLQAQFQDPVVDMELLTLHYPSVTDLLLEIKALGANQLLQGRQPGLMGKNRWRKMLNAYEEYRSEAGKVPATFEILYGLAWGASIQADQRADSDGIVKIPLSSISGLKRY